MDHNSSPGETWTMIPTPNSNSQIQYQSNQERYLHQQQQILQQQQRLQQQQKARFQQQKQLFQQLQQQNLDQSLASHFHRLNLAENLAEVVEHGNPDRQSDALIAELRDNFDKCQQVLKSISASISIKATTFEGEKKKQEEFTQLLNQRRDLIASYIKSAKELVRSKP